MPTGNVSFTSSDGGAFPFGTTWTLADQQGDVGVASCAIQVDPTSVDAPLEVTGAYSGDSTFASSSGSTQDILASPGDSLYLPTIQSFNPQTINATIDNPVADSTVDASGTVIDDLTEMGTCVAEEGGDETTASTDVAQPARNGSKVKLVNVPEVRVTLVRRHVPKGPLKVLLRFNQAQLRRAFPRATRVQVVVAVTIKPPHGHPVTLFRRKLMTLRTGGGRTGTIATAASTRSSFAGRISARGGQSPTTKLPILLRSSATRTAGAVAAARQRSSRTSHHRPELADWAPDGYGLHQLDSGQGELRHRHRRRRRARDLP